MTIKEAIAVLKDEHYETDTLDYINEAIAMAIAALEKQEYGQSSEPEDCAGEHRETAQSLSVVYDQSSKAEDYTGLGEAREKLVEMLLQAEITAENSGFFNCHRSVPKAECVADFLLKNGITVHPCKVGDSVYTIYRDDGIGLMVEEAKIIDISTKKIWTDNNCCFQYSDIGKTVFLSSEDIENFLQLKLVKLPLIRRSEIPIIRR